MAWRLLQWLQLSTAPPEINVSPMGSLATKSPSHMWQWAWTFSTLEAACGPALSRSTQTKRNRPVSPAAPHL